MNKNFKIILALSGGFLSLAVAMGIGRFAYTLVLPMMVQDGVLSEESAGYLASSNYIGYFAGSLFAILLGRNHRRWSLLMETGLIISVITTAFMGLTDTYFLWVLARFVSGFASAVVFILASNLIIDYLLKHKKTEWSGILYGGVGAGIVFSSVIAGLDFGMDWRQMWRELSAASLVLSLPVWYLVRNARKDEHMSAATIGALHDNGRHKSHSLLPWLIAAYGLEGLGYIVSGTFLASQSENMTGSGSFAVFVWGVTGAAALPSAWLWSNAARRWGNVRANIAAFLLQAAGMILPVAVNSVYAIIAGACMFGFTFMGIVTLTMSQAKVLATRQNGQIIAVLTTVYGLGQVIGPAASGFMISRSGSYSGAATGSAAVVLVGALLLLIGSLGFKHQANRDKHQTYG